MTLLTPVAAHPLDESRACHMPRTAKEAYMRCHPQPLFWYCGYFAEGALLRYGEKRDIVWFDALYTAKFSFACFCLA